MSPIISAHGLHRWYGHGDGAYHAVRGVDLEVQQGEVFALLGTNGAGKTSTLDLLEGLTAPDEGTVEVFGMDPLRDRRRVRPEVGIMLQSGGLPAELTVTETLEMWRGTCTHPTTADDVLAKVHLTDRADVRVGALSGGEQRRVDLACALLGRPRLLFLDEPTTGLDPTSRQAVWEEVRALNAEGTTVFLTTQYLEEADQLAGRVAIIDGGRIVREGDPSSLKEQVGDPTLRLELADPVMAETAEKVLAGFGEARPARPGRVAIGLRGGAANLADVVRSLDDQGVAVAHLELDSPSLDDVFADATGRRLEGAEADAT